MIDEEKIYDKPQITSEILADLSPEIHEVLSTHDVNYAYGPESLGLALSRDLIELPMDDYTYYGEVI